MKLETYLVCKILEKEGSKRFHTQRKKGTYNKNNTPGVLLLQTAPFFQRGTLFSLILNHFYGKTSAP